MSNTIPKIIHQTAPEDIKCWHPIWKFCQDSWKNNFTNEEYEYKFWNDDDIDRFIKTDFTEYYKLFCDFDKDIILKVDFVRYAILYKYGGIYADMDFFCVKNFYDKLTSNICIVESPSSNEIIQNSLMASPEKDKRWLLVMDKCKETFYTFKSKHPNLKIEGSDVIDISGPRLLSCSLDINSINILPVNMFNPLTSSFNSNEIYTKHYGTGKWGPKSGIRDFEYLRHIDNKLNSFYNDNEKNYNFKVNTVPSGYKIINIGNSNKNKKYIDLDKPLPLDTEFFLCKNNYKDTFSIKFINSDLLLVTRTDECGGWGEDHNLYIKILE